MVKFFYAYCTSIRSAINFYSHYLNYDIKNIFLCYLHLNYHCPFLAFYFFQNLVTLAINEDY